MYTVIWLHTETLTVWVFNRLLFGSETGKVNNKKNAHARTVMVLCLPSNVRTNITAPSSNIAPGTKINKKNRVARNFWLQFVQTHRDDRVKLNKIKIFLEKWRNFAYFEEKLIYTLALQINILSFFYTHSKVEQGIISNFRFHFEKIVILSNLLHFSWCWKFYTLPGNECCTTIFVVCKQV